MILQHLHEEICTLLDHSQQCVISTKGETGLWAVPAQYRNEELALYCLLPRWADAAYHLTENPNITLTIILSEKKTPSWYIQYRGTITILAQPKWQLWHNIVGHDSLHARFIVVKVTPEQIELVDQRSGWSRRELLKL